MPNLSILFQSVSFTYHTASHPLIDDLSAHFGRGWTGIVGANGVGKTTVLKLATGALHPSQGRVLAPGSAIYCHQRTDSVPNQIHEFIQAMDGDAFEIKGRLRIDDDWATRWTTLSHGERKRAQIAIALWRKPDVLAVDEPTNHLDTEAQDLLFGGLSAFRGVGLLVSHDRNLLDNLCKQCLFIDPPDALVRPGNYTRGSQQAMRDDITLQRQRDQTKRDYSRLKREAAKRRDAASQSHRKRSKRGLALKDHDTRAKINRARVTGKDGVDGKRLNQLEGRLAQAKAKQEATKVKRKYALGIWVSGARSKRNTLLGVPTGSLSLGGGKRLDFPGLIMKPDDRVALTGSNGSGKSTLIRHIMQALNLERDRVTYLPQEIDREASQGIMARARDLPDEKLGQMMTVVSRLGSRPHRLLESLEPSPGEIRKILLATGIANVPYLIVMDEPTNHLDLPSIDCLEKALMDCPCGLLLVSHDRRFLAALTRKRWHLTQEANGEGRYVLDEGKAG